MQKFSLDWKQFLAQPMPSSEKLPSITFSKSQLHEFVLAIELNLISLVQGLALAVLASSAIKPILSMTLTTWPYLLSGFLLVFFFWSQAIVHTLSFIQWPLDMRQNFLYFIIMTVEVFMFTEVTVPLHRYLFSLLFFGLGGLLYWLDWQLIKQAAPRFQGKAEKALYQNILADQLFGVRILIPLGFFFSLAAVLALLAWPNVFIDRNYHVILGIIQAVAGLFSLWHALSHYKQRCQLINAAAQP